MSKILIVEDEKPIADIVGFNLQCDGFEVITAYDGLTGLDMALHQNPDLMLLDVMLPGMDGFEVCRQVRAAGNLPIIMLTAREEETDKVFGLEIGADDYMTKPFSMRELLARVHANLRRVVRDTAPAASDDKCDYQRGDLRFYLDAHEVRKRGTPLELTTREYEILVFMAKEPNRTVTREDLMEHVWKYEYYGDLRTVDVAIRRLREKVEDNPADPKYIITKRGVGYVFRNGEV